MWILSKYGKLINLNQVEVIDANSETGEMDENGNFLWEVDALVAGMSVGYTLLDELGLDEAMAVVKGIAACIDSLDQDSCPDGVIDLTADGTRKFVLNGGKYE